MIVIAGISQFFIPSQIWSMGIKSQSKQAQKTKDAGNAQKRKPASSSTSNQERLFQKRPKIHIDKEEAETTSSTQNKDQRNPASENANNIEQIEKSLKKTGKAMQESLKEARQN